MSATLSDLSITDIYNAFRLDESIVLLSDEAHYTDRTHKSVVESHEGTYGYYIQYGYSDYINCNVMNLYRLNHKYSHNVLITSLVCRTKDDIDVCLSALKNDFPALFYNDRQFNIVPNTTLENSAVPLRLYYTILDI